MRNWSLPKISRTAASSIGCALEVAGTERQLDVGEQPVEFAVADRVVLLLAQLLADDALDLVGVLEDAVQRRRTA